VLFFIVFEVKHTDRAVFFFISKEFDKKLSIMDVNNHQNSVE
jgi:hypothetical protein